MGQRLRRLPGHIYEHTGAIVKLNRDGTADVGTACLYDGGVYDNLGLEPFFDAGRGVPKNAGEIIVVSDAGAPLKPPFLCSR